MLARALAVVALVCAPSVARVQPAVQDFEWECVIVRADEERIPWCPDCAWVQNLGVVPLPEGY